MMSPSSEHTWTIRTGPDGVRYTVCKQCWKAPTEAAKTWPLCKGSAAAKRREAEKRGEA